MVLLQHLATLQARGKIKGYDGEHDGEGLVMMQDSHQRACAGLTRRIGDFGTDHARGAEKAAGGLPGASGDGA